VKPLNPLFKWFGSSWSSAKHYPKPLDGLPIFEPFAGSAGYSLNHYQHDVVIYDSNQLVKDLWLWLINEATTQAILDIPVGLPVGHDIRSTGLSYGQCLLLKHWQRTNNVGDCWTISPWGDKPGQWVESCRKRVAEQVAAIKHWQFRQPDWTEQGTWMCDSPYIYNYQYGVKNFDYDQYVQNVNKIPEESLVICCEAVCKKTGRIPDYLPFTSSHSQVTSRRKQSQSHHSKELVYVKYT
jgi:hypothetical protein